VLLPWPQLLLPLLRGDAAGVLGRIYNNRGGCGDAVEAKGKGGSAQEGDGRQPAVKQRLDSRQIKAGGMEQGGRQRGWRQGRERAYLNMRDARRE
jgi:hypothetical protein